MIAMCSPAFATPGPCEARTTPREATELDPRDEDDKEPDVAVKLLPLGPGTSTAAGVEPAPAALDAAPPEAPPSATPEVPAAVLAPPPDALDDVYTIGAPSDVDREVHLPRLAFPRVCHLATIEKLHAADTRCCGRPVGFPRDVIVHRR